MNGVVPMVLGALALSGPTAMFSQAAPTSRAARTLVAVLAHADDEAPVAPILARYAREGNHVFMLIVSDGIAGAGQQGFLPRPDSGPTGEALVRQRAEEARCAAQALGMQPPIQLGFPDGKLGDFVGDRSLGFRMTQRLAQELERLRPDVEVLHRASPVRPAGPRGSDPIDGLPPLAVHGGDGSARRPGDGPYMERRDRARASVRWRVGDGRVPVAR